MEKVAVLDCATYQQDLVDAAVAGVVDMLGGMGRFVRAGQRVCLKVNLVAGKAPEKCVTTNPAVVRAIAKLVVGLGATCVIADSAGGPFTKGFMNGVYKKSGMKQVADDMEGVELNQDFTSQLLPYPDGYVVKKMPVLNVLVTSDVVINLCKMKAHTFSGFTGACKNLYGAIPGLVKMHWHDHYRSIEDFSDVMLDIHGFLGDKLQLHIVDAVDAMEGKGPLGGTAKHVGLILGSTCPHSADVALVRLMGGQPEDFPTLSQAVLRGHLNDGYGIEVLGTPLEDYINPEFDLQTPRAAFTFGGRAGDAVVGCALRVRFGGKYKRTT